MPRERAMSGTIPSMEPKGDALRNNTVIVGMYPYLWTLKISFLHYPFSPWSIRRSCKEKGAAQLNTPLQFRKLNKR